MHRPAIRRRQHRSSKLAKLFQKKDPAKARDYLEKAITAAPESAEAEEAEKLLDALE